MRVGGFCQHNYYLVYYCFKGDDFFMKNEFIFNVISQMSDILNQEQLSQLKTVLHMCLKNCSVVKDDCALSSYDDSNIKYLRQFLLSKGATGL